jgi:hypothetical protein
MRMFTASALLLATFGLVACGGDSTGPSDANVGGAWTFTASNMSGAGVSCNLSSAPLSLTQTGTTFSGTYGAATLSCSAGAQSTSGMIQGVVVNGSVDGNAVEFDLDTQDFHHTGSVSGSSMSGTARWTFDFGGSIGVVVLNGNWAAAKQ